MIVNPVTMPPLMLAVAVAVPLAVVVPAALPPTNRATVAPGSTVPMKTGDALSVILSESRGTTGRPVSEVGDKAGAGATGGVAMIVTVRPGLIALGTPATLTTTAW